MVRQTLTVLPPGQLVRIHDRAYLDFGGQHGIIMGEDHRPGIHGYKVAIGKKTIFFHPSEMTAIP